MSKTIYLEEYDALTKACRETVDDNGMAEVSVDPRIEIDKRIVSELRRKFHGYNLIHCGYINSFETVKSLKPFDRDTNSAEAFPDTVDCMLVAHCILAIPVECEYRNHEHLKDLLSMLTKNSILPIQNKLFNDGPEEFKDVVILAKIVSTSNVKWIEYMPGVLTSHQSILLDTVIKCIVA